MPGRLPSSRLARPAFPAAGAAPARRLYRPQLPRSLPARFSCGPRGGLRLPFLLVLIFGLLVQMRRVVFEQSFLKLFFGDACGFSGFRIVQHRPSADQQLACAARDDDDVCKLALGCVLEMRHLKISLQKTLEFRGCVLHCVLPGTATPARLPEFPALLVRDYRL